MNTLRLLRKKWQSVVLTATCLRDHCPTNYGIFPGIVELHRSNPVMIVAEMKHSSCLLCCVHWAIAADSYWGWLLDSCNLNVSQSAKTTNPSRSPSDYEEKVSRKISKNLQITKRSTKTSLTNRHVDLQNQKEQEGQEQKQSWITSILTERASNTTTKRSNWRPEALTAILISFIIRAPTITTFWNKQESTPATLPI